MIKIEEEFIYTYIYLCTYIQTDIYICVCVEDKRKNIYISNLIFDFASIGQFGDTINAADLSRLRSFVFIIIRL